MKEFQVCLVESFTFLSASPRPKGFCEWLLPTLWVHKVGVHCEVAYFGDQLPGKRDGPSHFQRLLVGSLAV